MNTLNTHKSYVLPIVVMYLLFFMIAFVTNLCSPMAVIVKNNFTMSNFASQLGNAANFIAYALMGIPSGMLLRKLGYKKTALVAIFVGFVGVFLQYMSGWNGISNFWVYLIGAFTAGCCMCILNTVVNPMLNNLGGGGNRGNQLVQFGGVCGSTAAVLVTILMGSLIADASKAEIADATPALMIALGVFAFAFMVLCLVHIPEPILNSEDSNHGKIASVLAFRHFTLGAIAIFMYLGIEAGIPTYVMQYLTTSSVASTPGMDIDASIAGMIVAVYWFLMLVGRFIGGFLSGRFSSKTQIVTVSSLTILLVLLGMYLPDVWLVRMPGIDWGSLTIITAEVPVGVFALILVGLCTSVMWGGIFNMAVEGLGSYTSVASGIFMTMVCGGGILIPLQGKIADMVGSFQESYLVVLVCAVYILVYALWGSKIKENNN